MKYSFLFTLAIALSCGFAANRIGPVSQYGQLQAGKNSNGHGRIYGSCPAYSISSKNEVAVQGMSLFWSISSTDGSNFWSADIVKGLVEKQKIQLIRAPMGVDENWGEGNWSTDKSKYSAYMNTVVQAAIDNDIYVIIDYHSHCAEQSKSTALAFFTEMAQKWGKYDNVIFEIYNEPKNACNTTWFDLSGAKNYWSTIRTYANEVISVIRTYSDNLIVVGTPYFDQYPNAALNNPLNDNNVAYAFHYYAGEDPYRHTIDNQGANAVKAMNGGLSVFVSEWGNSAPSGNGGFNASYSATWYNWMKQYGLSGANWSVSAKAETASYFNGSAWNYSESGNWVNSNVFSALPAAYTKCSGNQISSSSEKPSSSSTKNSSSSAMSSSSVSSSSVAPSSSSQSESSSSSVKESSSSEEVSSSSAQVSSSSTALSSSSLEILSSSSVLSGSSSILTDWESNTQLSSASGSGVTIGQSKEYNSERQVSKVLGTVTAGKSYTLSFDAFLQNGGSSMEISTVLDSYCSDTLNVNAGETKPYQCRFTASSTETVTLKLTMPGARWEPVTISNLSLKSSDGKDITAIASNHSAVSLRVSYSARILEIQSVKPANVDVFDMQGRMIKQFSQACGQVPLKSVLPGTYIVRVQSGSENWIKRISVR